MWSCVTQAAVSRSCNQLHKDLELQRYSLFLLPERSIFRSGKKPQMLLRQHSCLGADYCLVTHSCLWQWVSCFDWGPVFLSGGQHCGSVPIPADKAVALSTQRAYLANQKPFWTATLDIFVAMNGFYGKYVMWPLKEHLDNVQWGKQKGFGPNWWPQRPNHALSLSISESCVFWAALTYCPSVSWNCCWQLWKPRFDSVCQ